MRFLTILSLAVVAANASADEHAEAIYQQSCASCHGKDYRGGNAQNMVDGVWQFGAGDDSLERNIKFGIAAVGMPAYGPTLSDDDIRRLVRLLRDAQNTAGAERPPLPEKIATRDYDVKVTKWIDGGLEAPWGLQFVDERTAYVTEKAGRLRVIRDGVLDPTPVAGTPKVFNQGQGGLMDVAVEPVAPAGQAAGGGWVYLSYSHAIDRKDPNGAPAAMTRVVRGRIVGGRWADEQVVFKAPDSTYRHTQYHYGSRIVFDRRGTLYFSIGERGHQDDAQNPRLPNGKVHRLNRDGSVPADNPFADGKRGMPSVFTYGNRNPQGLATHPVTGAIWETEHGPMGGDEVNVLRPGANYGWPKITYGINYNGTPVSDRQSAEGMEQPVMYWAPSIAVCGAEFCRGKEFPRWENHLVVGGLGHEVVYRLAVAGERVMHQEQLLKSQGRIRDIAVDPSGALYLVMNGPDRIVKLTNGGAALRQ